MIKFFDEIKNHQSAITTLVGVNIKTTVATTRLGWIWWIVNPLILMMIYYMFVNIIMDRGGENYHLFVLIGIVAWQSFSTAVTGTAKAVLTNKQLIRQVALPVSILIIIPILVQLFFNSIGMILVLFWNYQVIGFHSILVIPLLFLIGLIVYGLGLFLSVITVFVRDTTQILAYLLRAGFFLTPILYPASRVLDNEKVPELAKIVFKLNPMTWIISALREVLLEGHVFSWQTFFIITLISLLIIQIGLYWLRKNSSLIIKML